MWSNKYIGIPYLENGRTAEGVDCWGLVRHIYKEELNIDLPSFFDDYRVSDTDRINDLLNQYKEGWEELSLPEEYSVVLFRILGKVSHIGIMLNEHQFIHNARNKHTSIGSINDIKWKNRCVGFFKYTESSAEKLKELPIALKSKPLVVEVEEGFTIGNAFDALYTTEGIPDELKSRIVLYIDGKVVSKDTDKDIVLKIGQRLEYRLVPSDDSTLRTVLTIAVIYVAVQTGMWAVSGMTVGAPLTVATQMVVTNAVMYVGMQLVNAIAPIRFGDGSTAANSPDSSNPQLLLTGSRNEARQYDAIPVVLGTYRYIAPLAASNYLTVENDISYLRMLLCWGYGDLDIPSSSIRVGDIQFLNYLDVVNHPPVTSLVPYNYTTTPQAFTEYGGKSVHQEVPSLPLVYTEPSGSASDAIYKVISSTVDIISISIHFPEGLRCVYKTGGAAGTSGPATFSFQIRARKLDPVTLLPIDPTDAGWIKPYVTFPAQSFPLSYGKAITGTTNVRIGAAQAGMDSYNYYVSSYSWTYTSGYVRNLVYVNPYGIVYCISSPPYVNPGDSQTITGVSWVVESNSGAYAVPVYSYSSTTPTLPSGCRALFTYVTYYNGTTTSIYSSSDTRTANGVNNSGSATVSGTTLNIPSNYILSPPTEFTYGVAGTPYYLRKDAFTDTTVFNLSYAQAGPYEIKIQRTSDDVADYSDRYEYKSASLFLVTGYNSSNAILTPPKNTSLTISGIKAQATDQLNGNIEGINAVVSSKCIDYDIGTSQWTTSARITNNPAALFRFILQHPANMQAISDADIANKVDLQALANWYVFCNTNNYTYNAVIVKQRSLLDVMRDICAAGRASPILVNGKWSVVIDTTRSTLVQHFTPHNSWGFEANRMLSTPPHALKTTIVSATTNYTNKELIVYSYSTKVINVTTVSGSTTATVSDSTVLYPTPSRYNSGYANTITIKGGSSIPLNTTIASITNGTTIVLSASATSTGTNKITFHVPYYAETSSIYESIVLPGVTNEAQAIDLAKFHLAQSILRPETYSINVDMEHLVCTRGDLVRVTHDVPMWGISTGRIKNFISTTQLELAEEVPMDAGVTYTIRIRLADATSITRSIAPVAISGYYTSITLTSAITSTQGAANNLYMIGTLNSESVEMLVLGIEPSSNLTAKITLVDYSPEIYTYATKFNGLPSYNTNITYSNTFFEHYITSIPIVSGSTIRSDESVMELSGSSYIYKMSIPFKNPAGLEKNVTDVEYRICLTNDTSDSWRFSGFRKLSLGAVVVSDVIEGETYSIQLRYVSGTGYTGPWSTEVTHTIIGKSTPPASVSNFTTSIQGNLIRLSWDKNQEIDVVGYEIRTSNTGWGTSGSIFSGNATNCTDSPAALNTAKTWYIKALDAAGNYSSTATSVSYTVTAPATYNGTITYSYADTSITDSTITINWTSVTPASFNIASYEVTITKPGPVYTVQTIVGNTWTTLANWIGNATITIKSIDVLGNKSVSASAGITATKNRPNAPSSVTFTVIGSQVSADWADVAKTTLPVTGYEIRKNNASWGTVDSNYVWSGSASNTTLKNIVLGANNWYINTYDTDNVYASSGTLITYTALAPNIVTGVTSTFSDTAITNAVVRFDWTVPTTTSFAISKYTATLTKPGGVVVSASLNSNTWTTAADWVGTAVLSIQTIDINNLVSSTNATLNVVKSAPNNATNITNTVNLSTISISWTPAVKTTLPIYGYEIRSADTNWGTSTGLLWRGATNYASIDYLTPNINTFYIRAFDTDSIFSTTTSFNLSVTAPLQVSGVSYTYASTSTSGNTVTFNWTGNAGTFNIASYNVKLTKPGSIIVLVNVSANTWVTQADWIGNATLEITGVDTRGNLGTLYSTTVTKTAPTAPSIVTTTANTNGITILWNSGTQGSLPIAGYELRNTGTTPGTSGYLWKGTASSFSITTLSLGSNTWDLWAYDTDLRYSSVAAVASYTAVAPSVPLGLTGAFNTLLTSSTADFTWNEPSTSVFGINRYSISFTTTNPVRTINASTTATSWSTPADWLGSGTINVTAYDNQNFPSPVASFSLTKSLPNQPGVFYTPEVSSTSVILDWPDTVKTSLPIIGYELRSSDTGWGSSGYLWKGNVSTASIDMNGISSGTTVTWYLKAIDSDNRYSSTARSVSYTVNAPANTASVSYQFTTTSLTSADITLSWADTIPVFGLKQYQINGSLTVTTTTTANSNLLTLTSTKGLSVNDIITNNVNIPSGRYITQIINSTQVYINSGTSVTAASNISTTYTSTSYSNSTSITQSANWLGDKVFNIKTIDLLNNISTGVQVTATKLLPGTPSNFRAQIIDNNVLLYWDLPNITTLPISLTRIKKGTSWATGTLIGDKSGTFTNITELIGGTYTYWIAVVDTDNNESSAISLAASVSPPPDYIFNAEWISSFSGTKNNSIYDIDANALIIPINTTETFSEHFTTRSWAAPSDQVTAGYPVYIQPGTTSGYYEEVFDFGSVIGSSQVTVAVSGTNIVGTCTNNITISTSSDNISYPNVFTNTTNAFSSSFRYVKVRVTVTQSTTGAIYAMTNLSVRLDAKQKTDSGTVSMSVGAAHPQGNISHDYVSLWVPGSIPTSTFTLNGTASENSITNQAGPGGYIEPIWNCIDSDVGSDADGGWTTSYFTVDATKGHLFAVFMKTTTNNGQSYWGTSQDSTIYNLAGTVNSNPYFISGVDLPALDTWYLLVGYVHEIGYGTTDTGISGIYNLSGTKVASGTEYKFNTGTTSASHRAYHYYNTTNSSAIVQNMARPIVIPCTVANATNMINYILQCATSYGSSVEFTQQFIDITSINTTPQGSTLQTSIVDFNDIANPKRFNIFNYNSSGTLIGGNVSWTVRGY